MKTRRLAIVLVLSVMLTSLAACGGGDTEKKDDFMDYNNNQASVIFIPDNNAISTAYTDAIQSQDEAILMDTLNVLPDECDTLLAKMNAYKAKTTEVQELHDVLIEVVQLKKDGYTQMLAAFSIDIDDTAGFDTAFAEATSTLDASDAKFEDFITKRDAMIKDLGLTETNDSAA